MTIQEYVAEQTERIAAALADFVGTTDPACLGWEPALEGSGQTRSVLDQIAECVSVNSLFAALLRGTVVPEDTPAPQNAAEAQAQIVASAGELAAAICAVPDEALEDSLETPRGAVLVKNLVLASYRNMAYHAGQINFIQMLAGDTEFHTPPNWR